MLKFKKITEKDFDVIDKYFDLHRERARDERFCDYAPGTVKMWHREYSMEYAVLGEVMYLRANYEEESGISYLMPVGRECEGELLPLARYLENVKGAALSVIPRTMTGDICEAFKLEESKVFSDRDWADYVYLREELCHPSGKKHHNYKYNLNKFAKEHTDSRIEVLCDENRADALSFFEKYCRENPETSSVNEGEYRATVPVIKNPELYSMTGALLRVGEAVIGLTLGEVYGDTVIIHTEKAEKKVHGAYQTLARGYLLTLPEAVKYVNREEDMGLEGLRRSKLSYAPLRLDFKYTLYL